MTTNFFIYREIWWNDLVGGIASNSFPWTSPRLLLIHEFGGPLPPYRILYTQADNHFPSQQRHPLISCKSRRTPKKRCATCSSTWCPIQVKCCCPRKGIRVRMNRKTRSLRLSMSIGLVGIYFCAATQPPVQSLFRYISPLSRSILFGYHFYSHWILQTNSPRELKGRVADRFFSPLKRPYN